MTGGTEIVLHCRLLAERLVALGVTHFFGVPGELLLNRCNRQSLWLHRLDVAAWEPACPCQHVHVLQLPSLGLCALSGSAWAEHSAGDFNLALLDELIAEPRLQMISCCNELNAGCAGRTHGGALLIHPFFSVSAGMDRPMEAAGCGVAHQIWLPPAQTAAPLTPIRLCLCSGMRPRATPVPRAWQRWSPLSAWEASA